ncbi:MAG: PqqD family protein [Anaerolineales bacterium]
MANWDDVLVVHSDVVTREAEGESVVVLPAQGKFIVLNATGALVLQLADGTRALHDIAAAVAERFATPLDVVEPDVLQFADILMQRGVLISAKQSAG